MNRAFARITGLVALTVAAGCHSYRALPPEQAAVGSQVRARLSAAAGERAAEALGREARVLTGAVVQNDGEVLLLSVPSMVSTPGLREQRLHQNLPVSRSEVVELEIRRLDPWRTGALVAGAAAVVGYVAYQAFDVGGSSPGGGRTGGEQARIPILSFPIW